MVARTEVVRIPARGIPSQPHDGTIVFENLGDPVEKMEDMYWTARSTTGEITLIFRERTRLEEVPAGLRRHPVSGK